MSTIQAMTEYVEKIKVLDSSWDSNATKTRLAFSVFLIVEKRCK